MHFRNLFLFYFQLNGEKKNKCILVIMAFKVIHI